MAHKTQYLAYIGKVKKFANNSMILEGQLFIAHARTIQTIIDLDVLDENFDIRNVESKYLRSAYDGILVGDIKTLKSKVKDIKTISITRDGLNWHHIYQD